MARPTSFLSLVAIVIARKAAAAGSRFVSATGDPLYQAADVAVALVGWSFCNEAEAPPQFPDHPSPRWADCSLDGAQRVSAAANALGPGDAFPLPGFNASEDANDYAVSKELFLGELCSRPPAPAAAGSAAGANWSFHTVMFKSGNMDIAAGICPETAPPPPLLAATAAQRRRRAPSGAALGRLGAHFNNLLMNQPLVTIQASAIQPVPYGGTGSVGFVAGTYDVNASWTQAESSAVQAALAAYTQAWVAFRFAEADGVQPPPAEPQPPALLVNQSYVAAIYWRNVTSGSLCFMHLQQTSKPAPWLMNYLKLMDSSGVGGGYDWSEAGDMFGPVPSFSSRLLVTYSVLQRASGGFGGLYVPCHGGCWQLDGSPCSGDLDKDITRYLCFIAESGQQGCSKTGGCPAFHVLSGSGERVYPNDTARFPYHCYSGHCSPGACDPYSNPGPQELMMLLPCSEWAEHGYPEAPGQFSGQPLVLDVGALGARVAFSGAEPADIGAAERARRGWAPLPDLSTLPPYPGWTRSWVGFDFGEEQPFPGLVRYEFTGVDVQVLAA